MKKLTNALLVILTYTLITLFGVYFLNGFLN
jgi:hypothetical protein